MKSTLLLFFVGCIWATPIQDALQSSVNFSDPVDTSEESVGQLKKRNELRRGLSNIDPVTYLLDELRSMKASLYSMEDQMKKLQNRANEGSTKVAFSVSLFDNGKGHIGPFNSDQIVAFKRVLTNLGDAYNRHTGVFTAPVTGVYYFSFTAFGFGSSIPIGTALYKNGELVTSVYEAQSAGDNHEYGSNSAVLQLQANDNVYIYLPQGRQVYDDDKGRTTFAGYLLWAV